MLCSARGVAVVHLVHLVHHVVHLPGVGAAVGRDERALLRDEALLIGECGGDTGRYRGDIGEI